MGLTLCEHIQLVRTAVLELGRSPGCSAVTRKLFEGRDHEFTWESTHGQGHRSPSVGELRREHPEDGEGLSKDLGKDGEGAADKAALQRSWEGEEANPDN